ncbi:hypothetical protein LXL04_023485 [Taraxacum kok-saghyz]
MFVFLKPVDSETSARPLLGADANQCLQTSSNFLNLITSAAKGDLLSSIAIQQPLHQAHRRLQHRSSPVFSAADRRCSSPPYKPSISSHNGRFSHDLQPISADFTRFVHYKHKVNTIRRKGLSLQKDSWNKVGRVLKDNLGVDLTQKQLKNSYDNLKAKYTGWIYLMNKTGNLYNAQINTFNLTAEEMDIFPSETCINQ